MSQIFDRCFVGSWESARDKKWLIANKITHICSCAPAVGRFHPHDFIYKLLPILDIDCFDPYPYIEEGADFIDLA